MSESLLSSSARDLAHPPAANRRPQADLVHGHGEADHGHGHGHGEGEGVERAAGMCQPPGWAPLPPAPPPGARGTVSAEGCPCPCEHVVTRPFVRLCSEPRRQALAWLSFSTLYVGLLVWFLAEVLSDARTPGAVRLGLGRIIDFYYCPCTLYRNR